MGAPATCTVSGTLYSASGAGAAGALVRARVISDEPPVAGGDGYLSGEAVSTFAASDGSWSLALPQGATVWLEIQAAGINHETTVPASATADVTTLSLSARA